MKKMKPISYETMFKTLNSSGLLRQSLLKVPGQGFLQTNSDTVSSCDVFLAMKGVNTDAHDYIPKAISKGATCIIFDNSDKFDAGAYQDISWAEVTNSRAAWAALAAQAYGNPQEKLPIYGVTGTNGKTSTTWMAGHLLRLSGAKCLTIGTLGANDGINDWSLSHTTPDPPELFALLSHCVDHEIPFVIMEVSSHSMAQQKVFPLTFAGGVFTSFSRDHLDFHKTMADYWDAKLSFFLSKLKKQALVLINDSIKDFPFAKFNHVISYGCKTPDEQNPLRLKMYRSEVSPIGQILNFKYMEEEYEGEIPFTGSYNAENFLAAWAIAKDALGKAPHPSIWRQIPAIPGRCEIVNPDRKDEPTVIVDFAHTPDALKTVLHTLKQNINKRIWLVFGCGGNRDKGKRPEMAKIGEDEADFLVLTSDNPRNESPSEIIEDMKAGLTKNAKTFVELKRENAIAFAIRKAGREDIILIAGKGHENYQIFKETKIPFCDKTVAIHCLETFWRNNDSQLANLQTMV